MLPQAASFYPTFSLGFVFPEIYKVDIIPKSPSKRDIVKYIGLFIKIKQPKIIKSNKKIQET